MCNGPEVRTSWKEGRKASLVVGAGQGECDGT